MSRPLRLSRGFIGETLRLACDLAGGALGLACHLAGLAAEFGGGLVLSDVLGDFLYFAGDGGCWVVSWECGWYG